MKTKNWTIMLALAAALIFQCPVLEAGKHRFKNASDSRIVEPAEALFGKHLPSIAGTPDSGLSAAVITSARPKDFRDAPGALKAGPKAGRVMVENKRPEITFPASAVTVEKMTFRLAKKPGPGLRAALEGMLSASYIIAVKNYSGDGPMGEGFTYSLATKGAVYPFSEIEVSCIVQEKHTPASGPEICGDFLGDLNIRINSGGSAVLYKPRL